MRHLTFICQLLCLGACLFSVSTNALEMDPKEVLSAAQLHLDGTIKEYAESILKTAQVSPPWKSSEERSIAPVQVRLQAITMAVELAQKTKKAEDWIIAGAAAQYAFLSTKAEDSWRQALDAEKSSERAHFLLALSAAQRDDWSSTTEHFPSLSASMANRLAKVFRLGRRGSLVSTEYLNAAEKFLTIHPTLSTSLLSGLQDVLTGLERRDPALKRSWQERLGKVMLRSPVHVRQGLRWVLPTITSAQEKIPYLMTAIETLRTDSSVGDGEQKSNASMDVFGELLVAEPSPLRQLFDVADEKTLTELLPRLDSKEQDRLKVLQSFRQSPSATSARMLVKKTLTQDAPWTLIAQVFQEKGDITAIEELSPDLLGSIKTWNQDSFPDLGRALGIFAVEQFKTRGATGARVFLDQGKTVQALEFETKYLCPNCHSFHTSRKSFRFVAHLAIMAQPQISDLAVQALLAAYSNRDGKIRSENPVPRSRSSDGNEDYSLSFLSAFMPIMPWGCEPTESQRTLFQAILVAGDSAFDAKETEEIQQKLFRDLASVLGSVANLHPAQRASLLKNGTFHEKTWSQLCRAVLNPPGTQRAALESAIASRFDTLVSNPEAVKYFLPECAKMWLQMDGRSSTYDPPSAGGDPQGLGAQILMGLVPSLGASGSPWGLSMDLEGLSQRLSSTQPNKEMNLAAELRQFLWVSDPSVQGRMEVLERIALSLSSPDTETWTIFPLLDQWIRSDPKFWNQAPPHVGPLIVGGISQALSRMDAADFALWIKKPDPSPHVALSLAMEWRQRFSDAPVPTHLVPLIAKYFAAIDTKNPMSIESMQIQEQSQDAQALGFEGLAPSLRLELAKTALEQSKTSPPIFLFTALRILLDAHQAPGFADLAKPILKTWNTLEPKMANAIEDSQNKSPRIVFLHAELLIRLGQKEEGVTLLRNQKFQGRSNGLIALGARLDLPELLDEILGSDLGFTIEPCSERWSFARPGQIAALTAKLKNPDAEHFLWASLQLLPQRLGMPRQVSRNSWSGSDRSRVEAALRTWRPTFSKPDSATTVINLLSQISPAFGLLPGESGPQPCSLVAQQILKPDQSKNNETWRRKENTKKYFQQALERGDFLALQAFLDKEDLLSTESRYNYIESSHQYSASIAALLPFLARVHEKAGRPELSGLLAAFVAVATNPEPAQRMTTDSWRYLVKFLPPHDVATASKLLEQASQHGPIPSRISAEILERHLIVPTEGWLENILTDDSYMDSMQTIAGIFFRTGERSLAIKALDLALANLGDRNPDLRIGLEQRKFRIQGQEKSKKTTP